MKKALEQEKYNMYRNPTDICWILQDFEENVNPFIMVSAGNFSNYYILESDLYRTRYFRGNDSTLQWTSEIT